jgi:hypothetical protein
VQGAAYLAVDVIGQHIATRKILQFFKWRSISALSLVAFQSNLFRAVNFG